MSEQFHAAGDLLRGRRNNIHYKRELADILVGMGSAVEKRNIQR
jgi:hypothetical protein